MIKALPVLPSGVPGYPPRRRVAKLWSVGPADDALGVEPLPAPDNGSGLLDEPLRTTQRDNARPASPSRRSW